MHCNQKQGDMATRKTKRMIQITKLNYGLYSDLFCDQTLLLRRARKVGDREVVNNYVYGVLKRFKGEEFDFIEVES